MKFQWTKTAVGFGATMLIAAAISFGATTLIFHHSSSPTPTTQAFRATLTSVDCPATPASPPNFSVCGPAVNHGPVVYPGGSAQTLPITFYNSLNAQLQVTSLSVTFTNIFPAHCLASDFRFNGPNTSSITGTLPNVTLTFTTPLVIPVGSLATPGTTLYNASLKLLDDGNQTTCETLPLVMSYSATATVVYTTNPCGTSKKINGSYTVGSGQLVSINCTVTGSVTVQSGGALYLQGATVSGGITTTGATAVGVCASSIAGGITATGTTGSVLIGDGGDGGDNASPPCTANTIKGGVTLTNGHGGFEIGGNSITGGVSVTNNTGTGPTTEDAAPEIEGNTISGGISCAASNIPAVTDGTQKNTVTGSKSGECSAAGF